MVKRICTAQFCPAETVVIALFQILAILFKICLKLALFQNKFTCISFTLVSFNICTKTVFVSLVKPEVFPTILALFALLALSYLSIWISIFKELHTALY